MDIVTHGLLGALVAQSITRSPKLRLASVIGCTAALLPDLDVLIQSDSDPLLVLEYHRHFTHSILFAPLAALLLTWLCAPLVRTKFSKPTLFLMVLLSYLSACLLDACTSYGTHLLWPLIGTPMSLGIIAVVDPVFTGILFIAVIAAWIGRRQQRAWWGIVLALGYLTLAWVQHERAHKVAVDLAQERQLPIRYIEVKPTMGNILLWRALTVTTDQQLQVDAVRVGMEARIYPGERRELLQLNKLQLPSDSMAYRDLIRYQHINQPLLVVHSEAPLMIGDARYAMLPTQVDPLWGLQINNEKPNQTSEFVTRRKLTSAMRQLFIDMLLGREVGLVK